LASRVVEGRIDRRMKVLIGAGGIGDARRHDLAPGHGDVDPNAVVLAVVRVAMRQLERDSAGHDARVEPVELCCSVAHVLLDGVRMVDPMECDLERKLHGVS
jgi:hypothetical protein